MIEVKQMPYEEMYEKVRDSNRMIAREVPAFITEQLGNHAAIELQAIWQQGTKTIPAGASAQEKYEAAYNNWIWMVNNNLRFIQERLGDEGLAKFKRTEVEALKKENASPSLIFLNLIRTFSPGTTFRMTAKEFAYQLQ